MKAEAASCPPGPDPGSFHGAVYRLSDLALQTWETKGKACKNPGIKTHPRETFSESLACSKIYATKQNKSELQLQRDKRSSWKEAVVSYRAL